MSEAQVPPLIQTLKKAATTLREAGIPFALAGGGACYARGGGPPAHDVDFVILEADVEAAGLAFASAGFRVERPPEGWLIKAFDGECMVDLIYALAGRPVTWQLLDRADEIDVAAVRMPVLGATDLVLSWLWTLTEHHADFAITLTLVRPLREQVDWAQVRAATRDSAFARAFLVLLEGLGVLEPAADTSVVAGTMEQAVATDPRTHELGVRVDVEDGTARLRGEVASAERRSLIEDVAREAAPDIPISNEVDITELGPPGASREPA